MDHVLQVLFAGSAEQAAARLGTLLGPAGPEIDCCPVADETAMRSALLGRDWDLVVAGGDCGSLPPASILGVLEESGRRVPFITLSSRQDQPGENGELFRSLLQHAPLGVLVTDADGRHLEANTVAEQLLGYDPGGLVGLSYRDIADAGFPFGAGEYRNVMETGFTEGMHRLRRRNGTSVWIAIRAVKASPERVLVLLQDCTRHVQAEQDLLASEARFRSYIENAPVAAFIADSLGRYVDCNPAAAEMLGYDVPGLLGRTIIECVPPEDLEATRLGFQQLIATGRLESENRLIRADGSIIWISLKAVTIPGGLMLAYCVDITESKRAQTALLESEARFRALFENSPLPMLDLDASGLFECLRQLEAAHGPDTRAVLENAPQAAWDLAARVQVRDRNRPLFAGDTADWSSEAISRLLADGLPAFLDAAFALAGGQTRFETGIVVAGPDGERRDVIATLSVAPGHEQTLSRVFVTLLDITGRERAAEALREREAQYRAVIETSADGFLMLDLEGRILEANDSYAQRSGYSREELLQLGIADLEAAEDAAQVRKRLDRLEKGGSELFETRHRAKDGAEWLVEVNASFWPLAGGRILSFLRDVCRRKRSDTLLRLRFLLSELAEYGTVQDLMQAAVDEAETLTGSRAGVFQIQDGESGIAQVWSERSVSDAPLAQREPAAAAIWSACLQADGPFEQDGTISAPVRRNGRLVAALSAGDKPAAYGEDDLQLLHEIAALATEAVERKQTEERLRESEQRLNLALTASGMGVWEWDCRARRLFCSPECGAILGWQDIVRDADRIVHPDDRERITAEAAAALRERRSFEAEFRILRPDLEMRWIACLGDPSHDENGEPVRIVGTIQDITAGKRAAEAVRISEERHRALVETSFDWIWEIDSQGLYSFVSPGVKNLLGYEPEELLGRSPFDFMPPAEAERVHRTVDPLMANLQPLVRFENVNLSRDGRAVVLETSARPIVGPDGEPLGYRGTDHDITGQKMEQMRAVTREAVSRSLSRSSPIPETAREILRELAGTWGWDRGSLWVVEDRPDKLRCMETWPANPSPEPPCDVLEQVLSENRTAIRPPGRPGRDCWEVAVPIRADGRAIGVLALRGGGGGRDVDARQQDMLEVIGNRIGEYIERRRAQQKVERFVASSPAVLYALEAAPDGLRLSWTSDNLFDLTGYRPEEAHTAWWHEGLHPEDRDRIVAANSVPLPGSRLVQEFRFRRKDGAWIWVRDEKRVIHGEEGAPDGIVGSWTDVTERVKLEEQLRQSQKMEAVGAFAGGMAHDFNNLLTVINGYTQMMLSSVDPADPLRAGLEEVHRAGARAAILTRQLMSFGGGRATEPQLIGLNRVVTEMQPMLGRLVGEQIGLCIFANAERDAVWADRLQIEQIVVNLALNARDAMPRGGILTIETAGRTIRESHDIPAAGIQPGDFVVLEVTDNGAGMTPEIQTRIFEPFYSAKPPDRGTGLGLTIVQGMVKQSGGFIEVESRQGEGSTFRIFLPASDRPAAAPIESSALQTPAGAGTILVVEDQEQVRLFASRSLRKLGYQVLAAANAEEALRAGRTRDTRIDVALIDLVIPGMSGPELARTLLALRPGLGILHMSGYSADDAGLGDTAPLLRKPFTQEELAIAVRETFGRRSRPARILVADDEPGVRRFLRTVLEKCGFEVVEAIDGMEAMKEIRRGTVDLFLTDLIMPEQEGIETIRKVRKEKSTIPIIAMSGKLDYLRLAQTLGADATLEKPVSPAELETCVHDLLRR